MSFYILLMLWLSSYLMGLIYLTSTFMKMLFHFFSIDKMFHLINWSLNMQSPLLWLSFYCRSCFYSLSFIFLPSSALCMWYFCGKMARNYRIYSSDHKRKGKTPFYESLWNNMSKWFTIFKRWKFTASLRRLCKLWFNPWMVKQEIKKEKTRNH